MKIVLLTYYVGLHEEVMGVLGRLGLGPYSRWREVEGRNSKGDPRDGTAVWPGLNSVLMVAVDPERARSLLAAISQFNRSAKEGGVDAYVLDVAEAVLAAEAG